MMRLDEVWVLNEYFTWVKHLREEWLNKIRSDEPLFTEDKDYTLLGLEAYRDYALWLSLLCTVCEGWDELHLSHKEVDKLKKSNNMSALRKMRNGTFHYKKDFFASQEVMASLRKGPRFALWCDRLTVAFSRFFAEWAAKQLGVPKHPSL